MKQWPHAPAHWTFQPGIYMVTAATYRRLPHLAASAQFWSAATSRRFGKRHRDAALQRRLR